MNRAVRLCLSLAPLLPAFVSAQQMLPPPAPVAEPGLVILPEYVPSPEPIPSAELVTPDVAAELPAVVALPCVEPQFAHNVRSSLRLTTLPGLGDKLGQDSIETEMAIITSVNDMPIFTVKPGFGVMFLDGPVQTDLPPRLYNGQVDVATFGKLGSLPIAYELAATPSIYTDGENMGSDAFRMMGRGVLYFYLSERTQLVGGVAYLDRRDVPALPILGVISKPNDDTSLELVFPRPRALRRVGVDAEGSTWAYVAGEFGGGSYAIQRANGANDVATLRDYRLLLGLERRRLSGLTANLEAGYVFGRRVEYASDIGNYSPDGTLLLRLAVAR